jgi:hypothetical protein
MRRSHKFLLLLALVIGGVMLLRALPEPRTERDWIAPQARQATAQVTGDELVVRDVRNFRYDATGAVAREAWEERRYDLRRLNSAWLGVSTFGGVPGVGHVFASFGFDDGRYLAVSVEARREQGESYGVFAGAFREYELIYIVADELDVIGLRTNVWRDPVYLYPIVTEPQALRRAFLDALARATALDTQPEFYDTLANSCSVNLVRHVNFAVPGKVPGDLKVLLAAFSDALAHEVGLIAFDGTLEQARARFRVNERAAGDLDAGDFPARIRAQH